jgi:hypothetical protein
MVIVQKQVVSILAGVLLAICVVAGCGSSSSDDAITTTSLSKAEFIKEADAVCTKSGVRLRGDFQAFVSEKEAEGAGEAGQQDYAELVSTVIAPNIEREIQEIRDLGAPKGDVGSVTSFIEVTEQGLDRAEANPRLVTGGKAGLVFSAGAEQAKAYGFKVCS